MIRKLSAYKLGLEFSLILLEPCLNTSFTLANLEDAGNEPIHQMKSVRIQTFIGQCFPLFNPAAGKLGPERDRRHVYSSK